MKFHNTFKDKTMEWRKDMGTYLVWSNGRFVSLQHTNEQAALTAAWCIAHKGENVHAHVAPCLYSGKNAWFPVELPVTESMVEKAQGVTWQRYVAVNKLPRHYM